MLMMCPKTHSELETTCAQCRRYSAKKKGVRRVSAVLPKWMVGKFLQREFARLQEKITLIQYNFEVCLYSLPFFLLLRYLFDRLQSVDLKSSVNRCQAHPPGLVVCPES